MDSTNVEWWIEQRDWLLAAIERTADDESLAELRGAVEVCESEIAIRC